MKWILVVLIGGVTPVTTDVTFEKLSDCLAAEQQLRQAYADAFDSWNQRAATSDHFDRYRRRDHYRAREMEAKRFANTGTCVPHAGTEQPIVSLDGRTDQPAAQTPAPSPSPSPSARP
jgi:hypothetical protein